MRVAVAHSTVNYKDALAVTGKSPVVRKFPMVPGIDFAGVVDSADARFKPGTVCCSMAGAWAGSTGAASRNWRA